ncbi:hypothetical protein [Dendrosporobacter sp. 1207_IL3150]|uniref:hypothetical protein n=1 Tax=Dendrosporobacter sp. 1207_IL3150 TaxID=3084054 RepID=UPI002FDB5903
MWPGIYEFASTILAVLLCAASIKLVDDYLDRDLDNRIGRTNWAHKLGNSTTLYSMMLLIIAAGLNSSLSLSLFLSSYIIGMFNDLKQVFPSKLTGFQESLVVLVIGVLLFKWDYMLFSLLFVSSIQLIDDCIDYNIDTLAGYRNFAHRFGVIETMLIAAIGIITSWWINETIFTPVISGTIIFYIGLLYKEANQ